MATHTHICVKSPPCLCPCCCQLPASCKQVKELAARVSALRERHLEQTTRLLALARYVTALEGRFALYSGRG